MKPLTKTMRRHLAELQEIARANHGDAAWGPESPGEWRCAEGLADRGLLDRNVSMGRRPFSLSAAGLAFDVQASASPDFVCERPGVWRSANGRVLITRMGPGRDEWEVLIDDKLAAHVATLAAGKADPQSLAALGDVHIHKDPAGTSDDFTVTGDELDRCLDRAERAQAALRAITQEIPTFLLTNETGREVYARHVAQIKAIHEIANAALVPGDQAASSHGQQNERTDA